MSTRILIAGTMPHADLSLTTGEARLCNDTVKISDKHFPLTRGTAAMLGAACAAAEQLGTQPPVAVIAGDIGTRSGSRLIYRHLIKHLPGIMPSILGLHYIVPDIGLHNQMLAGIRKLPHRPCLIADAGFMYVAKASGQACSYDLFLPDIGELAFLADNAAPHPAYTRGFFSHLEGDPLELMRQVYRHGNAARCLCVKGAADFICSEGAVVYTVAEPVVAVLEAVGGTGDTISGMVTVLISHGASVLDACRTACQANRLAGQLARATPATQIGDIICRIPAALKNVL